MCTHSLVAHPPTLPAAPARAAHPPLLTSPQRLDDKWYIRCNDHLSMPPPAFAHTISRRHAATAAARAPCGGPCVSVPPARVCGRVCRRALEWRGENGCHSGHRGARCCGGRAQNAAVRPRHAQEGLELRSVPPWAFSRRRPRRTLHALRSGLIERGGRECVHALSRGHCSCGRAGQLRAVRQEQLRPCSG